MTLAEFAIRRPVTTFMGLVSLMVLGAVAIWRLPLGFMPDVSSAAVYVEVPYPNAHPLEIVRDVIEPLEDEIALVPGLKQLESEARSGSGQITCSFDAGDNLALRRLEIRDAVDRARPNLPSGVDRILVNEEHGGPDNEAVLEGRIAADRDLSRDWDLIERRVKGQLERIPGVARVDFYGIDPPRLEIDLDLDKLRQHRVTPQQIAQTIEAANSGVAMGVVRGPSMRFDVRGGGRPETADDVAALPIAGSVLRVGDLARVSLTTPDLDTARRLNGKPAIGFDVFKAPSANTVAVAGRLKTAIEQMRQDEFLRGIDVLVRRDQAEEIKLSLDGLFDAGWHGGILSVVVMLIFLRRVSSTLVIAVAIPFSLISTCAALYVLGMELNVLTMLGLMLGVGLLVDDAIVVMENVHRLQERGLSPLAAAEQGASDVALAVTASTATTVIVWAWLLFAPPGVMTTYLSQVAVTVSLAITCSLLVSLTFIPLAVARFIKPKSQRPGFFARWFLPLYQSTMRLTLRHRMATLLVLFGLALSTVFPFNRIEKTSEPKLMPTRVPISMQIKEPITLERFGEIVQRVENAVEPLRDTLRFSDVYSFYNEQGWGAVMLVLPRELATEEYAAKVREAVKPLLPVIPGVEMALRDRMFWRGRGGGGGDRNITLALRGNEPEGVLLAAAMMRDTLAATLPAGMETELPQTSEQKEALIVVDPDRLRQSGTSVDAISTSIAAVFRGQNLRRLHTPRGERDVFIGVPERDAVGLAELENLPVPTTAGSVPLGALTDMQIGSTPDIIRRDDRRISSFLTVSFPKQMTTDMAQAEIQRAMRGVSLPLGSTWDFGNAGREREQGLDQMQSGTLLSLLVVMLLMAAMFESVSQPLAIFITLPLAFCGALWALWAGSYDLDTTGFMGVIILIGIVVKNGIVMVDHINMLRKRGMGRHEAVIAGCSDRVRPVLMTAICTIVGLIPLAASRSTVAGAFIDSMAVVVIGGMATSTIFTLVGLPVWYTVLEDAGVVLSRALGGRNADTTVATAAQKSS
ncbi:MAG: efflux RND transporter permease subunit [Acidobacteriota bacterium]